MVKILIKKTSKEVITPKYKTDGSSGVDLSAFLDKEVVIKPNSSELIPTGLQVAIPEELEIQIRPRSGLAAKESIGVLNSPGTIDSDYRGELKIILFNHGNKDFIINNGDRIAQMVLVPILKMEFEEVDSLPETIRGQGGFGSTGKK
jgi:dUTP pyrophosphatase